ncbi:hypothetical protein [Agrobacterium cavarae]|uniref:hypothetical protein n=1 Tax=Agrobacterium cavarae TaxID=2528239 RepID=UPI00289C0477|nr:hypothetical protein [Agrobacterium cavarae]
MLDEDLKHRARRLIAGDFRSGDLDRLFLGQRDRAWGRACFREVGDFVAHRDTREKGLITQVGRDVFTSVDVWSLKMRGRAPSWTDIARAAEANLRLASDEQIRSGCGCQRGAAKKRIQSALTKIDRQEAPTEPEIRALEYLGNRFIWKPAFTSNQLLTEFRDVLTLNGFIGKADAPALENAKAFISLYALAVMHGSAIVLEGGDKAKLFAGFANRGRHLEVKVEIVFNELGKPLMAPVCLFLTDLSSEEHCELELTTMADPVLLNHWDFPIEVGAANLLVRLS